MIHALRLLHLLRRHVLRCPDDFSRVPRWWCRAPQNFGDAEISNLHAALLIEQQVLGLDIAMDYALIMRVLQRLAHRWNNRQCFLGRKPPLA